MSAPKYTAGPWHTDGVVIWASDNAGKSFDVPVCVMTARSENGLTTPAENAPTCGLENADLIAAAPDLLEALKAQEWGSGHFAESCALGAAICPDFCVIARAAIAKAEKR